jgi:uncharacterized membrane protein
MDDTHTEPQPQAAGAQPPVTSTNFDLNHPTIISLCYLASFAVGFTSIIGLVLAYIWKGEAHEAWEDSHYQYLIRTFWLGLLGFCVGFALLIVLIGIFVLIAVGVWMIARAVMSLINAQKRQPMPNPQTWLI